MARRVRARATHLALAAVIVVVGLVAFPGMASAAGSVTPLVDCVVKNSDGSWTAVFGYDNSTGTTVTIPVGLDNYITPRSYGSPQPTTFAPGVHRGAFTVPVQLGEGPVWTVEQRTSAGVVSTTPACPSSTELPATGNGTGPVIGLAVAGVVGAVVVHRANRRARALAGTSRGDA